MLLSEAIASSPLEIRRTFEAAFPTAEEPNKMSSKELFGLISILYRYQTNDEQKMSSVNHRNNVGFSVTDAKKLTDFYRWFNEKHFYSDKQKVFIGELLRKHCGQLIRFWIDRGVIKKLCRGMYSYESKAERQARQAKEAEEKVKQGAAAEQARIAAMNTPEARAEQRAQANHGQLDFLNDL